jgi:MoxR-like ATPase
MALALLSSIAGESIFLLGPPGVAKSLIARRLKYAYEDAKVFEYLMSRFSTPDEIFGPVSISKLKNDTYERIIENYLPSASAVFLDEIWKAGPSIQNALLTILNEKLYRNGAEEISVPMKALISASNELPAKDQGLEALWDRFLLRLDVGGIEDEEKFDAMIAMPSVPFEDTVSGKITGDDYETWSAEIDNIEIPENVFHVIHYIRGYIEQHNQNQENAENQIYVSDRRWRKITRLLRTSAFLNDRTEVDLMDCFLIKHCIWNDEEQIDTAFQFVSGAVEKHGYTVSLDFNDIRKELAEFQVEIDEETKFVKDTRVKVLGSVHNDYYEIVNPPNSQSNLINQNNFKSLTNANQQKPLYYWHPSYQQVQHYSSYNTRKGNSKFSIFINDTEYQLKTTIKGDKRQTTKKPHPKVEESWDQRTAGFLEHTGEMKKQIEHYQNKDLEHLRVNLFVKPELANIVEAHITETLKEIDKIELEIRQIQNRYKILKNEEVVLND